MTTMLAIEAPSPLAPRRSRYAWVDALVTSTVIAGFAIALLTMAAESLGGTSGQATYATATQRTG